MDNCLNLRIVVVSFSKNEPFIDLQRVQVLLHRVCHVAPPLHYSSSVSTNQMLALERFFSQVFRVFGSHPRVEWEMGEQLVVICNLTAHFILHA